jgi:hypothetical protein
MFQKGNQLAKGRPKGAKNIADRLRADYGDFIMRTLLKLSKSKDEQVRLRAACYLGDRAWGRPAQQTTLTGANDGPIVLRWLNDPIIPASRVLNQDTSEVSEPIALKSDKFP